MRHLFCGLALFALSAAPVAAQGRATPVDCPRELFQTDAAMRREQTRMQAVAAADQAAQCRAWREHVTYLQKARAVFATCQTGRTREENVGQMDASLSEFRVLLANRCSGR